MALDNPFVGPRPLGAGNPIFGRDRELRELKYLLVAERIVLLHSPSGAGKSSLLRAQGGLLEQLRPYFYRVWDPTRVNLTPDIPVKNRFVWSSLVGFRPDVPCTEFAEVTFAQYAASDFEGRHTLLIFDQFEEIIRTESSTVADRQEFFRQLGEMLALTNIWALFVMREDFLATLDPYARLVPTHFQNRYRMDLLNPLSASAVIIGTAAAGGRTVSADAAAQLAGKLVGQDEMVEPLQLQVVGFELWKKLEEHQITEVEATQVQLLANVDGALGGYYDSTVATVGGGELARERAVRQWVGEKLITARDMRGMVLRGETITEGLDNDLAEALVELYLVRRETRGRADWYELAHDRLIRPVKASNRGWFERSLHWVQKLALIWAAQGEPDGLLISNDQDMQRARQWRVGVTLTAVEDEFLRRSEKELERSRKLEMALARADNREAYRLMTGSQIGEAMAYAARALEVCPGDVAATTLLVNLLAHRSWWLPGEVLSHHNGVLHAAFSADGKRVATVGADQSVKVWNAATGEQFGEPIRVHDGSLSRVAFVGADGGLLLVERAEGQASFFSAADGGPFGDAVFEDTLLSPNQDRVACAIAGFIQILVAGQYIELEVPSEENRRLLSFSSDGSLLLTASAEGAVFGWETTGGRRAFGPLPAGRAVRHAAVSPDNRLAVTVADDGATLLWNVGTGELVAGPLPLPGNVGLVCFDGAGELLLTLAWPAEGEVAQLWSTANGVEVNRVSFSSQRVFAAFQPGAAVLALAEADSIGFLRLAPGSELVTMRGASVDDPRFHFDGSLLLTGKSGCVFDTATMRQVGAAVGADNRTVSFSPVDDRIVTASETNQARVWELARSMPHGRVLTAGGALAMFPDGRLAVGRPAAVEVWDPAAGRLLGTLAHAAGVACLAVNGDVLATVSADRLVRVWQGASLAELGSFQTNEPVRSVVVSPDGQLVILIEAGEVVVRDAANGAAKWRLPGIPERFDTLQLSPDGRFLLTSVAESPFDSQLFDFAGENPTRTPFDGAPNFAYFSPDGRWGAVRTFDPAFAVLSFWDLGAEPRSTFTLMGEPTGKARVLFSPDSTRALLLCEQTSVFDLVTGKQVGEPLGSAAHAVFSPDSRRIATAENALLRIWDAATGTPLTAAIDALQRVEFLAFTADGQQLVTADTLGQLRVWNVLVETQGAAASALLSEAACTIGGFQVSEQGTTVKLPDQPERIRALREQARQADAPPGSVMEMLQRLFGVGSA